MTIEELGDAILIERSMTDTVSAIRGIERVNLIYFPAEENYSGNADDGRVRIELTADELIEMRAFLRNRKTRLDDEFEAL